MDVDGVVAMGGTDRGENGGARGPSMNNDNTESHCNGSSISDSGGGN